MAIDHGSQEVVSGADGYAVHKPDILAGYPRALHEAATAAIAGTDPDATTEPGVTDPPASTDTGQEASTMTRREFNWRAVLTLAGVAGGGTAVVLGRGQLSDFGRAVRDRLTGASTPVEPAPIRPEVKPEKTMAEKYPARPSVNRPDMVGNIDTRSLEHTFANSNEADWNGEKFRVVVPVVPDVVTGFPPKDGKPHVTAIQAMVMIAENLEAGLTLPDGPSRDLVLGASNVRPAEFRAGLDPARDALKAIHPDKQIAAVAFDPSGDTFKVEYVAPTDGSRYATLRQIGGVLDIRVLEQHWDANNTPRPASPDDWHGAISRITRVDEDAFKIRDLTVTFIPGKPLTPMNIVGLSFTMLGNDETEVFHRVDIKP